MAIDLEKKKQASELIKNADKLLKSSEYASALEAVEQALQLDPANLYAQAYRERIKSIMAKAGIEEKPVTAASQPVKEIPKVEPSPLVKEVPPPVVPKPEPPKPELPKPAPKPVEPKPPVAPEPPVPAPQPVSQPVEEKKAPVKEFEHENKTGKLRKLAAIMFTDIVGYSAHTQKNEGLALQMLDRHQKMVRPLLKKFEGKEIKTVGDAFLVEFVSVLQAARCALDIQHVMGEYNATAKPGEKIELRIGIHIGDVIYMDNDILGDGVNIASRIQDIASPGGIYVSQDVYNQIRSRDEFIIEYVAEMKLKNIISPVPIYKLLTSFEAAQKKETEALAIAIEEGTQEARKQKLQEILASAKQHLAKNEDNDAWFDATRLLKIDPHHAEAKLISSRLKTKRDQEYKKKIDLAKQVAKEELQALYKEVLRHALIEGDLTPDERDIFLAWRRELSIEDSTHDAFLKELKSQKK